MSEEIWENRKMIKKATREQKNKEKKVKGGRKKGCNVEKKCKKW